MHKKIVEIQRELLRLRQIPHAERLRRELFRVHQEEGGTLNTKWARYFEKGSDSSSKNS
jgi:hypothetical protein